MILKSWTIAGSRGKWRHSDTSTLRWWQHTQNRSHICAYHHVIIIIIIRRRHHAARESLIQLKTQEYTVTAKCVRGRCRDNTSTMQSDKHYSGDLSQQAVTTDTSLWKLGVTTTSHNQSVRQSVEPRAKAGMARGRGMRYYQSVRGARQIRSVWTLKRP